MGLKFGNAAWGFRELSLQEQLRITKKMGLAIHELGIANAPLDLPLDATPETLSEVKNAYDESGVQLLCAATGNDFTVSYAEAQQAVEKIKRVVDICGTLGVKYLRIFAGFTAAEEITEGKWNTMISCLKICDEYAQEKGVTLCVETHGGVNGYEDGVEHFYSTSTDLPMLYKMLAQLPETMKLVYDPANLFAVGIEDPAEVYYAVRERIGYIHMKDFKKLPSGHLIPSACGEGSMQWDKILQIVKEFEGPVLFEYELPKDVERGSQACVNFILGGTSNMNQYKTSRAVVIERPYVANLRTIQLTDPRPDAFVAKTLYSSISTGTDMKTYKGMQHPEQCYYPLVPGYETAGVIVQVPEEGVDLSRIPESARNLKVGDRVMINECRQYGDVCAAWGGGSEYTIKDSFTTNDQFDYMVKIPDNVTDEQAVLAYLACVPLKGISRMTLRPNETIVVIGAGMVGISAIQELKILEPSLQVICIERNAFRRSIAENYADIVTDPESAVEVIRKATNGKMADQLMECSGNPEVVGTLHKYIKDGGWEEDDRPAHIHLQGDYPDKIIFDHYHRWFVKNATITMTCALKAGCKEQVLQWISEGKFDTSKLPYEVWPVSKCKEAFEYLEEKGADAFKIIFDWSK